MLGNWTHSVNYESYFSQCSPSQCTYIQEATTPVIEAVSVVIGLLGGLSISVRLFVESAAWVLQAVLARCGGQRFLLPSKLSGKSKEPDLTAVQVLYDDLPVYSVSI